MSRAYPIQQYPAKCQSAAAMMHMIMNNLNPVVAQVGVRNVVKENCPDAPPLLLFPLPPPLPPSPPPSPPFFSPSPSFPPLPSVSPGAGDVWWQWPSVLQLGTILVDSALSLCNGGGPDSCDVLWPPYGTLPKPPPGTTLCHYQWHGTSGRLYVCL